MKGIAINFTIKEKNLFSSFFILTISLLEGICVRPNKGLMNASASMSQSQNILSVMTS
jgi:hypothetical protein